MTSMEIYLIALGSVALFLGGYAVGAVMDLRRSHVQTKRELAESGVMELKLAEVLSQHSESLRNIYDVITRHERSLGDHETKIMGAFNQSKDIASLRTTSREADEILLEKLKEHARKLDALAVAMLKKAEEGN